MEKLSSYDLSTDQTNPISDLQQNSQFNLTHLLNRPKQLQDSSQNLNNQLIFQRSPDSLQIENFNKKNQQTKIKFRKLKQKLMSLCLKHEEIPLGKEATSANKPRLMKLSIELQRQINNQIKDYGLIQNILREVLKILQQKKQNDLHIIRQSRFVPSIMQFYKKILSSHKSQYRQGFKIVDLANKILIIFCCFSINREYLILTNRLQVIITILNWALTKKQEINQNKFFITFFTLISTLIDHKPQHQSTLIIQQTLQFTFASQFIRRLRNMLQISVIDDTINDQVIVKNCLKLFLSILFVIDPENEIRGIQEKVGKMSCSAMANIQIFVSYLNQFTYVLLFDKDKLLRQSQLSNNLISTLIYIFQILNRSAKICMPILQKNVNHELMVLVNFILIYCKQNYDEFTDVKQLINQIIIFLGYISFSSIQAQNKINQYKILTEICNLPIQFMMDKKLAQILNPTLCCLIYNNQQNFKQIYKQMSLGPLKKYLQNEIQQISQQKSGMHSRKYSLSSMNSINTQCSSNILVQKEWERQNLRRRFSVECWKPFLDILQKFQ